MRPGGACLQVRSDLIQYQFQRDYSSHRVEVGLDEVLVNVGRPSQCSDPYGNDGNLHQTGGHEEMRKGKTPEYSKGLLTLSPWPACPLGPYLHTHPAS